MCTYRIRRNIGESNIWRNSAQQRFGGLNIGDSHACIHMPLLCKNIIGGLNIGNFIQKSPIAKVYSKIANCQSLLLANISSYTVYVYVYSITYYC